MNFFSAFIAGLSFGVGLIISHMVDPQKVLNFLDITGTWDASLLLVMGTGLSVFTTGYFYIIKKRTTPLLATQFFIPNRKIIDGKLLIGAIFFGMGWGLTGICPGPAITNILSFNAKLFTFIGFMLFGMFCARLAIKLTQNKSKITLEILNKQA